MARRRRGQPVHGWIVLDKPGGMTSTQAVAAVKRLTDAAKAGHAGTLDPLATGVLPIALGEATKTMPFVVDAQKRYRFTVRWGEARSTDDAQGEVTATSARRPSRQEILTALPQFLGTIEQVPPAFSALKVDGQRAYDLARAGQTVELAPRWVRIDRFELVEMPDADHAVFVVACGKGAYMRALCRDLARSLGTLGHLAALRRTAVGRFDESRAISLERLAALGHSASCPGSLAEAGYLLSVGTALDDIPALALTNVEANRLRSGQAVALFHRMDRERVGHLESGSVVCATSGGKPVALARFQEGGLRPLRILNL
ncbi:MAG: tRNA pseudouridine(55) synthase TruB [Rhodospirillaceae bacterium]|nr:tRNA pseudouridine(55) synthase TruB [Rhodospirillaceae bacterium]